MTVYQELKEAVPSLDGKDKNFAESLINWIDSGKCWSDKQLYWAGKLIERANEAKPEAVDVGDFTGVVELFAKAKKHLKYPAIVLASVEGNEIKVKPVGPASQNAGMLYVYYDGTYSGKISPAGVWTPFKATDAQGFIWAMLKALSNDPEKVAAGHGKMTGKCCFCNTKLTDPKSTSVGYGPVCAKHYDLPWGEVKVGQPAATDVLNEMEQVSKNELAGELIEEVKQELDTDQLYEELTGVGLTVLTEADIPIQTHLDEPASQSPVAEQHWEHVRVWLAHQERERRRIKFEMVPGKAVKNLLEALHGPQA